MHLVRVPIPQTRTGCTLPPILLTGPGQDMLQPLPPCGSNTFPRTNYVVGNKGIHLTDRLDSLEELASVAGDKGLKRV